MEHEVAGCLQGATKIASRREEGSGCPYLPIPNIRVGRKEAFAKWFEDGADREELISIMFQNMLTNSLGAWKGEQDADSSEAEEGSKPTGTRTTGRVLGNSEEVVEEGPPPPPEGQCIQNAVEASPPGPPGFVLPIIFSELPRLCVLYRPQFGLEEQLCRS